MTAIGSTTGILSNPVDDIQSSTESTDNVVILAAAIGGSAIVLVAVMFGACFIFKRRKRDADHERSNILMESVRSSMDMSQIVEDDFIIPYSALQRFQELGRGAFGVVYKYKIFETSHVIVPVTTFVEENWEELKLQSRQ